MIERAGRRRADAPSRRRLAGRRRARARAPARPSGRGRWTIRPRSRVDGGRRRRRDHERSRRSCGVATLPRVRRTALAFALCSPPARPQACSRAVAARRDARRRRRARRARTTPRRPATDDDDTPPPPPPTTTTTPPTTTAADRPAAPDDDRRRRHHRRQCSSAGSRRPRHRRGEGVLRPAADGASSASVTLARDAEAARAPRRTSATPSSARGSRVPGGNVPLKVARAAARSREVRARARQAVRPRRRSTPGSCCAARSRS